MTRDELEAALRRNLTDVHVPAQFHNAVVDTFLPAAEEHAVYVGGITAERRVAIAIAADRPSARVPLVLTEKGQRAVALLDAYEGQQEPEAGRG